MLARMMISRTMIATKISLLYRIFLFIDRRIRLDSKSPSLTLPNLSDVLSKDSLWLSSSERISVPVVSVSMAICVMNKWRKCELLISSDCKLFRMFRFENWIYLIAPGEACGSSFECLSALHHHLLVVCIPVVARHCWETRRNLIFNASGNEKHKM